MKFGNLKATICFLVYIILTGWVNAQEQTQELLFQKYQTMVVIEELNQHCPMLSRLEAEVLNGQIIFADTGFSGKIAQVNDYKRKARLYARSVDCHAPQLKELLNIARQEANDAMVNHILLARQIHLFDLKDMTDKKIPDGLLLSDLSDNGWAVIDGLYGEVKNNYLTRADQDSWDSYEKSIIDVAEKRTAATFMENEAKIITYKGDNFMVIQAMTNNKDISSYYYNLDKSVKAFLDGSKTSSTGYPYSRPANDFTNWTAYRPRNDDLNWLLSFDGCGGRWQGVECILFISTTAEVGLVLSGQKAANVDQVVITARNSDDNLAYEKLIMLENLKGGNEADFNDLQKNAEFLIKQQASLRFKGMPSDKHGQYGAQTGNILKENSKIFIFPPQLLAHMAKLKENDVLNVEIAMENDGIIPINNYHRAMNWATSDAYYQ